MHQCGCVADASTLYDGFSGVGLQYGPSYRRLVAGWTGRWSAVGRLTQRSELSGTHVHPADLDDALCTAALIAARDSAADGGVQLPFAVAEAAFRGRALGVLLSVRRAHAFRARLPARAP